MPGSDGLDGAADDLYGQPRAQFTRARDALVTAARAAGNTELAAGLRALRKPTAAASLVNLLVRECRWEVDELVGLGARLRLAQSELDRDALRHLSDARHRAVAALSLEARRLAADRNEKAGDAVIRELEGTLEAASFDPDAGRRVLGGRLTGALSYSGLGFLSTPEGDPAGRPGAPGGPGAPGAPGGRSRASSPNGSPRKPARPRSEAAAGRNDERRAERAAREARRTSERSAAAVTAAEARFERARAALDAAQAELGRRREAFGTAERELRRARRERDEADRAARRADERAKT